MAEQRDRFFITLIQMEPFWIISGIVLCLSVVAGALTLHNYFNNKTNEKAFECGYEQQQIPGTSETIWVKTQKKMEEK